MVRGALELHRSFQEIHEVYPFPTTYLCEGRFSPHASTKTTYTNSLNVGAQMIIQLSSIETDIKDIL